jgi:hypothetical protein
VPYDAPLVAFIEVGESASLAHRHQTDLTFTSGHPEIATVSDDGLVLGVSPGSATIALTHAGMTQEIAISVVPATASESPHPFGSHPRLRFTADELAARKRLIERGYLPGLGIDLGSIATSFLKEAEAIVAQDAVEYEFDISGVPFGYRLPYPPAQPEAKAQPYGFTDYPFWTRLSRQIEDRLVHLTLAWSLTGETRFADKAKDILLGIAGWQKWHEYDKATNNLSLPHFTIAASVAYDELFDVLSEEERRQVRSAIVRLGLRPMSYWFDRYLDHNISVLMNAAMLFGYLAIGDEEPFLEKYLDHSVKQLAWYVRQREESMTTEPHVYTSYAMSTVHRAGNALQKVLGRDELLRSDYIRTEMPDFFFYQYAGNGAYANLSDCQSDLHPVSLLTMMVSGQGDPRAAWLLQQEDDPGSGVLPFIDRDVDVPAFDTLDYPLARRFDRIDWVALRSGWTGNDTVVVFNAGPSAVGHNHFDQNHFVLAVGGELLITDPGYQNYTPGAEAFFTNDTRGHNGLLVNGEGQTSRGKSFIVRTDFSEAVDTVTGDATAAYDGRVKRWRRTLRFVRDSHLLVIDEIEPATPADRLSLLFHTTGQVTANDAPLPLDAELPGDATVTFSGKAHAISLASWSSAGHTLSHRQHEGAERFGTWLSLDLAPATTHLAATLIQFDPGQNGTESEKLVVVQHETTEFRVGLDTCSLAPGPETVTGSSGPAHE